jgi:hypothetical protein
MLGDGCANEARFPALFLVRPSLCSQAAYDDLLLILVLQSLRIFWAWARARGVCGSFLKKFSFASNRGG